MGNGAEATNGPKNNGNSKKRKGNGNNGRVLSWRKRLGLYRAYSIEQSVSYVAKICGVSHTTARKYRDLDRWDERIQRLREQALKDTDKKVVKMLERQAADAQKVQALSMAKILGDGFSQEDVALRAFEVGARIERLAQGEAGDRTDVNLMDAIVERHRKQVEDAKAKQRKKKGKGKPSKAPNIL